MKKSIIKLVSAAFIFALFSNGIKAQSFQGTIEFKKQSQTDTTNYIYYVKDSKVRIDEIGLRSHKVEGSFLIDLDAKTMQSLNHERKLYMDQANPAPAVIKGTCAVKKGDAPKTLQGYKCDEYIVSNTEEETTISYYLADGKFAFFDRLLHQLNRKDKASSYFLQIPDVKGTFPMLSIQTDKKGKEVGRLEVTKIEKKDIDKSKFEIPKGYNKFEK